MLEAKVIIANVTDKYNRNKIQYLIQHFNQEIFHKIFDSIGWNSETNSFTAQKNAPQIDTECWDIETLESELLKSLQISLLIHHQS